MGTTWTNDDSLVVQFGTRAAEDKKPGAVVEAGNVKQLVVDFNYDDLPGGSTDGSYGYIPAGSMVVDAIWVTTVLFAGGTSYDVGLEQSDGSTAIDADGLFDALALADINTVGEGNTASNHGGSNSGALIGATLAADAYPVAAATGTFTAGSARLVIQYVATGV